MTLTSRSSHSTVETDASVECDTCANQCAEFYRVTKVLLSEEYESQSEEAASLEEQKPSRRPKDVHGSQEHTPIKS